MGAHRVLQRGAVVEVATGHVPLPQASTVPLEDDDLAAGRRRAEVDDVVGDRDHLGLVLDHEHGVALVAQPQQQPVHPLDVVRVQADGGLVEDVGDVGERRAEVADHLRALRLAARQRAGGRSRRGSRADLDERVERLPEALEQRRDRRFVEARAPTRRGR